MRNSALPIVSAVFLVILFIAIESRHPSEAPGRFGPELEAGIFRMPTKARLRIASADLDASAAVTVEAPAGADAAAAERWRAVVVSAEDREPLTNAVVLGLAEQLTEHGCVVIVDTVGGTPLLMAADRAVSVATREAKLPAVPGGECTATIAIADRLLSFPSDIPAAHAQPAAAAPLIARFSLAYRSQGKGQVEPSWAAWYAGVGRGLAADVVHAIVPAGLPAVVDAEHRQLVGLPAFVDWDSALPIPPRVDVLRWYGATQQEFARGWIGEIRGFNALDDGGATQPSIAHLEKAMSATRLLKDIAWVKDPNSSDERLLWNREQDGAVLAAVRSATGWDVALWQERTGIAATFQGWLDAAAHGDQAALRQLRRYGGCEAVPADLRLKAAAVLGAAPSAGAVK